jgi:heme-degrading monooxygenase HmoA
MTQASDETFRVDRFTVPESARDEFLAQIAETHHILRTLPGFVRDAILEKPGGPGELVILTIAEWDSTEAIANARRVIQDRRAETGFEPQEFMAKLGITPELASYRRLEI